MGLEVEIKGQSSMMQRVQGMFKDFPEHVAIALRAEAEIEMTEAKHRTPVKTGVLRASGMVSGPDSQGRVVMSFGGAAEEYAIEVHENLEMFHKNGQAKFLESVFLESLPHIADRVRSRVRRMLGWV